jgi:lipoprotein-anchoring transpeptidase ErfK/SrfK
MGPPDKQDEWVYVKSFKVGLGEANGTPVGTFVVKKGSKLIDPPWINPHTGEKFAGGDPKNPIGHRWVGLEGQGDSAQHTGYGIHGTIDPDSIGQQRSMGCVRMATGDIELVWELLGQQVSVVKIVP